MQRYDFKLLPEALRAGGIALVVFGLQFLVSFNVDELIDDWQTYVKSLGSGATAAAAAAILAAWTRNRPTA